MKKVRQEKKDCIKENILHRSFAVVTKPNHNSDLLIKGFFI